MLIEGQTFGLVTVGNDAVWYKTQQLNGWLIDKLLRMIKDGIDITPWANLLDNLMKNPDPRVHERLPLFLEEAQMPITMDGHFLSWRLVKDDYWDVYTGNTFHCTPGTVISMERYRVDSDPDATCSAGIHIAAFGYLDSYGFDDSGRRCMLVKTSPEHVVAVPTDYSNRKMRVCQTLILREVDKALVPALFGRDDHVADNNGYVEEDKEFSLELSTRRLRRRGGRGRARGGGRGRAAAAAQDPPAAQEEGHPPSSVLRRARRPGLGGLQSQDRQPPQDAAEP